MEAATIATSPNAPGNTDAKPTGKIHDLYPNQCIGIINPQLNRKKTKSLVGQIYGSVGKFKYVSLYQMSSENSEVQFNEPTLSGFEQDWAVYQFNLNLFL